MNAFSLKDKTFLVSGATSGIGLEICKTIVAHEGKFIGIGRNVALLESFIAENNLEGCRVIKADLQEQDEIKQAMAQVSAVDGFVHSAGIVENNPIQFFNFELYEKIRKVNLDSCLFILSDLLKSKKLNKGASVVLMSSISGMYGMKGNGLYGITKAALNIMAKTYANELSKRSIRVNTVAPGMVNTPITEAANEFLSEEVLQNDMKKYPLGYGEVSDVANPVIFLLSEASRWITGQVLVLDGGRTATI